MQEQDALIALLEWELCASHAREAELRGAVQRLVESSAMKARTNNNCASSGMTAVAKRHLARLRELLNEPQCDKRLRQRLESARWEAQQATGNNR